MNKIFLDDKRTAPQGYMRVRTARECIQALEREKIRVISLDYNLGKNQPKGDVVARYMARRNLFPPKIIIHSNSPFGRMKMYRLLYRSKPKHVSVTVRPLPSPH